MFISTNRRNFRFDFRWNIPILNGGATMKELKRDICVIENMLDEYKKVYYGNKNINNGEDIENEDDDIDTENRDKIYKMYNLTLLSIINGLYIVSHGLDNLGDIKELMENMEEDMEEE